ncbi:MAG: hypothetical protein Q9208_007429 [Pyrenodesmia sp. 3 TL-2023]
MDTPSTSGLEGTAWEHQLRTVDDLTLLRKVNDMQSLVSRFIQSTLEISGHLLDPAITRDEKTTHAVGYFLDHLDALTVLLEEEFTNIRGIDLALDEGKALVEKSRKSEETIRVEERTADEEVCSCDTDSWIPRNGKED